MPVKQTIASKVFFHPITRIVLGTLAILVVTGVVSKLITKPILTALIPSLEIGSTIGALISTLVMVTTYLFLMKYYEKRGWSEFSIRAMFGESGGGFLLGFGVISLEVLVLYLLGHYEIIETHSFGSFLPNITMIFGAAMLEELIFRGLLFRILDDWKGLTVALIVSSVLFQLPHFMNPNEYYLPALLGVLFGLVTAILYAYTRRLWLPFAFHFGWNLAQPTFGTNLSGIDEFPVLFEARMEGPELLTGSAFGIEDSILSLVVLVGLFTWFYVRGIRKGKFRSGGSTD